MDSSNAPATSAGDDDPYRCLRDEWDPAHRLRDAVGDEHLHDGGQCAACQQRADQRREQSLKNERQLDRPVRSADQPHDLRLVLA